MNLTILNKAVLSAVLLTTSVALSAQVGLATDAELSSQQDSAQVSVPATTPNTTPLRPIRTLDTAGFGVASTYLPVIEAERLREHVYVLASDSLQGRETGTEGQRLAAAYLERQLRNMGYGAVDALGGTYQQEIALAATSWERVRLEIEDQTYRHLRDFYAFPSESVRQVGSTDEVVFLGYGIDTTTYSDYTRAGDLQGKVVVVLGGEPFTEDGLSLITGTADTSAWTLNGIASKRAAALARGVRTLLVVEPRMQRAVMNNRARILDNSMQAVDLTPSSDSLNVVYISPGVLEQLVGKRRGRVIKARRRALKGSPAKPVAIRTNLVLDLVPERRTVTGTNVLGYLPGSDPTVADELVVVSAHYDHLGTRGESVFNGADDNASGSATIMGLAEAFAKARDEGQGPRRSVLLLWVSGEEKGLLGSAYYAARPVFPLETTVADVNIDMIGRYDEAHADSNAYIYVIGAGRISPDLDSLTRAMNEVNDPYELDYTFDAEDDPNRFYYRSDHYNFARSGIPSVFFFSGVHEDYHRPTDTPDKLDYEKMQRVGRHAFLIAWNLANREVDLNRLEDLEN